MDLLTTYGVSQRFINEAALYPELQLARVIAQYRGAYRIATAQQDCLAEISGKLRHQTEALAQYPGVGDFVMVTYEPQDERAIIHHILGRKSIFSRTAVGVSGQTQVIATNIDVVFICMSLNHNYNLSRLERYLSTAWDSGATPVVVLTKSDLCEDLESVLGEVSRVAPFCDVVPTSMLDEDRNGKLLSYLPAGVTGAFIGSSGVGKSTLINGLLDGNNLNTAEVGKEDKGRHTTTGREIFALPTGGVVIDTPGMRELGIESADLSKSFADIEELAQGCRFRDCTHTSEAGCALRTAVEEGSLDERRLENYFKIKRESGYEGLSSREIESKKLERMFKEVGGMKNARKFIKDNDKRKKF